MKTKSFARKRVFVSAPQGFDLRPIMDSVESLGLSAQRLDDFSSSGILRDQVLDAIKSADLAVLVIDKKRSEFALYEAGIAHAFDKPTLLLTVPGSSAPEALQPSSIVKYDPKDLTALEFWLRQAASVAQKTRRDVKLPKENQPNLTIRENWVELAGSIRSAWTGRDHSQAESLVGEALKSAGVDFLAQPKFGRSRPDFAGWIDELDSSLGNPFVIEVKGYLKAAAEKNNAFKQVSQYLENSNSKWALVLFMDGPQAPFARWAAGNRPVLFQRIDSFAEALSDVGIADNVRELWQLALKSRPEQ
jgi:hypothetical protein